MKYVVYLTYYSGDKLPPWYIGSSSAIRVENGYNGSIESKRFKKTYKAEQKKNKHLFKTKILSYHSSREEAFVEELRLHEKHNVARNSKYMNLSFATPGGLFGRSGRDHPHYGMQHEEEFCISISDRQTGKQNSFFGKSHSEESRQKMREKLSAKNNSFFGKKHDEEAIKKIKEKSGTSKGTVYVFNDELELCRRVDADEFDALISKGWKKGRKIFECNKGVDRIPIYNKEIRTNKKIYPKDLDYYISIGWKKGNYNFRKKKKTYSK